MPISRARRMANVVRSIVEQSDPAGELTLSGSGTQIYTNIADLPLSGNETGEQAFVEENNRLYIWTGTGWYNIALVNTTPTAVTGASGSYQFATDGTPVEVTLTSTDPEGIPLTWSYAVTSGSLTNGGGATATVSQAANVFTITPATTEAYEGQFSLTFTASDGVNIVTTTSSFTLAFLMPGGVLYQTPGTYSWTAPAGVTSVCAVCIGGGGGGVDRAGGGGGGLGWKNNIPVVPGQSYTVVVGSRSAPYSWGGPGGDSYFINTSTVKGGGGGSGSTIMNVAPSVGVSASGGTFIGDGGQDGGKGGAFPDQSGLSAGGGGAGGYISRTIASSGNGAPGGHNNGADGTGGGGGGGGGYHGSGSGRSGGGVGVYGLGADGIGGTGGHSTWAPNAQTAGGNGSGGSYGAGGGSSGYGTNGAVRIIWGNGRAFPSTNVDLASSLDGETTI